MSLPFDRPHIQPYLTIRPVPARFGPCHLWRAPGRVLIAVHPGTPRQTLIGFIVDRCTLVEHNAYRWHSGQGPVGTPLEDGMLQGVIQHVLPSLRLPSETLAYGIDPIWPATLPLDVGLG